MGDIRSTGQSAHRDGMYICLSGCGTMVKADKGEAMPICYYCLDQVRWRRLEQSGVMLRADLIAQAEPKAGSG